MNDTRLTAEQLDAVVQYAYGGGAYRAGRREQARTLHCLLRRATGAPARAADRPTT